MTRRRWIADEASGDNAALTGVHADHLVRVLRARVGQKFDIATGGVVRRGEIISVADGRVEFELAEEIPAASVRHITLLLSIFKFDRMEWAIEKCTELGVSKIIPVIARRTDAHLAVASAKRVDRWRRVANQAAEQSRRASPPEIGDPARLEDVFNQTARRKIVLSESEQQTSLSDRLASQESTEQIVLAVGPEGGWTAEELEDFSQTGWVSASLGSTILRAETAAIAAVAITISELGS